MDTIRSSEFRKRYPSLLKPTIVTVNGHTIGEWRPFTPTYRTVEALRAEVMADAQAVASEAWRPEFRPAPKPGRK